MQTCDTLHLEHVCILRACMYEFTNLNKVQLIVLQICLFSTEHVSGLGRVVKVADESFCTSYGSGNLWNLHGFLDS